MATTELRVPTWDDLARHHLHAHTGRDDYAEASYLLWNHTCFPFGSAAEVERQLVAFFAGECDCLECIGDDWPPFTDSLRGAREAEGPTDG